MSHEVDLLRSSMDAAPADWLDRLVVERVVRQVRRDLECELVSSRTRTPAEPMRARRPARGPLTTGLRTWLSKLLPPSVPLLRGGGGQRG